MDASAWNSRSRLRLRWDRRKGRAINLRAFRAPPKLNFASARYVGRFRPKRKGSRAHLPVNGNAQRLFSRRWPGWSASLSVGPSLENIFLLRSSRLAIERAPASLAICNGILQTLLSIDPADARRRVVSAPDHAESSLKAAANRKK
jgi:hypothetical protein